MHQFAKILLIVILVVIVATIVLLSQTAVSTTSTTLPVFSSYLTNVNGMMNQTASATYNTSLSGIDRTHTWLAFGNGADGVGFDGSGGTDTTNTTLAAAQQDPNTYFAIQGDSGTVYGKSLGSTVNVGDGKLFSGWLRTGSAKQCVGFVIVGGHNGTLHVTSYGFTSVAPVAQISSASTYTLKTANAQTEILSMMPTATNLAFMYDASVGTYGQVTWLSQI